MEELKSRVYKLVPIGVELDESFLKEYEARYFLDEDASPKTPLVVGVSQSWRQIENDMEDLLEKRASDWVKADVIRLLAWKMGRINHKKSKEEKKYIFTGNDNWCDGTDGKQLMATNRSGIIKKIDTFANNVLEFKKTYEQQKREFQKDPKELLKSIQSLKVNGIGSVYLITVLYFVSGGEYPIYDQFAMTALNAIEKRSKPGEKIPVRSLPDADSRQFIELLSDDKSVYLDYICKLRNLSLEIYDDENGYKGRNGRKIDRALWVYGHLFN